ncbi:MAG: InlB B-repeat-containing protein, partial [Lachnospiraceae bacterium]|nr:InlB B-repeat-containing protein [Lachnospiraceae bacterium]
NNKVVSASGTSTRIYSAVRIGNLGTTKNITVGTGSIVIKNNGIYSDEEGTTKYNSIKYYELFSYNTAEIFVQNAGTKFSKDSFIDGIAFVRTNYGFGTIMKNWTTNAEDPDNYETQLVADTYNRSTLKTVMDGDDLVINDGYFEVTFKSTISEVQKKLATQSIAYGKLATEPEVSYPDFIFNGWFEDQDYTKAFDFKTAIKKNWTLYAKFEKKSYNVVFISTLSTATLPKRSTKSVLYKEKVTAISVESTDKYKFIGWFTTEGRTEEFDFNTDIEKDTYIYAKWEVIKYVITYKSTISEAQSKLATKSVIGGERAEDVRVSIEGYTFEGWYTDETYTNKFDFNTAINEDKTLYAKFNINKYSVVFVSTLSSAVIDPAIRTQEVEYMSTPSEPKVSHDEFDFDGWFTTATYTTKYDFTKGIVEDTTIYAKWTRKIVIDNYYISFSKNQPVISGETISIYGIMNPQIATVGKTIRLSENKYYNDQVEFVGWSKIALPVSTGTHEEALELIDYEDNAEVKDLAAKDQTITLYAVWRSKVHMATLDAAGGEFDSGESSTQIKVIEDEYINLTMPLRRGYAFTGWTVDGASFTESKYIYDTDKTFVATWEPITFYVRYDGNHSDNDSLESMASVKVSFDEAYKLKVNEFIKNGYTFESWIFDNKEYSEDQTLADIIETMDIVQDQVLVFTAKWGPNEYTINYNNNGGSGTMNSSHPKFGTAFTLPEKTFTNGTKTFLGWNTDKDATKALYSDKASINPEVYAAVIDLYAIWYEETESTGKLTIDGNGGLVNGASSYTIMGELGDVLELPNLEREGHKLVGFTENGNPYIVPDVFDFTGEKTIKATWSEILYNIIYNSNDGKDVTKVVNDVRYNQVVTIIGSISETAGKIFESWNTDNLYNGTTYTEGQNVSQLSKVDGSDVNLYAKYKNHKVTITYDANTGSGTMNPVTYENNTDAYLEANVFTKANNSFIGWSRDKDAKAAEYKDGHRVDDITLTDDNVTLFAIWTAKDAERFIIYDAKGGKVNGKATDKVTVASGSTIIHPTPVYEGYKFNHWLDEDGNVYTKTIVDFDKEITLYADWTEGTYTLRYNGNGNTSGSMADEPVLYTSVHTLRNNTYGKNGYKFAGWDVSANATAVAFKNLATVSKLAKVDEVANIYAVWEGKEYKVVYNANGGDGTVATTSFVYGKNAILSENKFTKVGEVPKGWIYKSPTGDVEITSLVVPSTTFVIDDSTEVITLYANFAGKQMTATLDANGGKFSNDETTKTYSVKKGSVIAFEEATRTGYNLLGYTLDGALFKDATWNLPDSKTFIASWSAITYKIKFNGNGADNADAMGTQEFTYDKTEKLSKNKFEKTGYTFAGWKYDGEDYADEADILNITTKDNDELTFTANWTAKTFRINYDGNTHDGGETMAPTDGAYGKDVQLRKNAFTKKDYVFTGWAKTADGEAVYADLATISALEPYEATRTLYAKWIASKSVAAKIIVKGNGGLVNNAAEATLFLKDGQTITEPTKARTGYKFTEWTTLDGAKYEFPEICDFEGEVTIRANWTPITYYVVYRSNNSENKVATKSMAYDEEGTIMTNPWTYEGYNFDTWSTVKTGNGESFAEGSTYKNLSTVDGSVFDLYARWNGRQITINYNGNGSTYGTMASKTYTYGESSKLEENVFTKGQHTFGGWATSETGTAKYINRNDVDPIILAETSPLTLYAVWISNNNVITIGYNGNGGTISGETVVSKNVEKGSAFEILEAKRDGYTHTGYVNENKEPFTAGQIINVSTVAYATWTENTYTLTYDGKGNTHGSMASKDSLYTAEFNLAENNYRKLGYNFLGWDTDEAGATVVYADKATVSKLAKSGEVKLYAVWSPKTYKIVYNANGASGVVATTSFVYGQTANLAKNTFDKEFYEPAGWIYRKSDGSEVKYASEAPVAYDEFEYSIDSDIITLYANFSEKTYIATLKANGGKFSNGNTEKEVSIKKDD